MDPASIALIVMLSLVIMALVGIGLFIWQIFMIVDVIRRPIKTKQKWILINVLVPFGFLFYYFMIYRKKLVNTKTVKYDQTSLIVLVIGICAAMFFNLAMILVPLTLILGSIQLGKINPKKQPVDKQFVQSGIILSIFGLVFIVLFMLAYFGFFFSMAYFGGFEDSSFDNELVDEYYLEEGDMVFIEGHEVTLIEVLDNGVTIQFNDKLVFLDEDKPLYNEDDDFVVFVESYFYIEGADDNAATLDMGIPDEEDLPLEAIYVSHLP